ncbi:MAG: hypothetical protein FWG98_11485 [Candidatus Cloacimonetes bacterium]|nr:hypothetical protein [Candidatus Cloacimonadota bacterium]
MREYYEQNPKSYDNKNHEDLIRKDFIGTPVENMIIDLTDIDPRIVRLYTNLFPKKNF